MSKISTYEVVPVPKLSDKLIGTSVGGEIEDVTYNFTLQELLEVFLPVIPANNLQGILDYGNTATQDINLFGTITTTNLDVTDTANLFITYLNEETHLVGSLFDSADSVGTAGQVLTSTGDGVEWFTLPPIFTPNLQQVLEEGNTADLDIILDANLEALDISADTATVGVNLTLGGTITDNNSAVGSAGQVLESTVTGVQWTSLPVYSATSPLLFNSGTGVFSIQPANSTQGGYLTANDWVTFDGKQNAGAYITALTGEATATGPGSVPITLNNASVIAKVLTGLNVTGGSISASDSILTAFGKVQNQINGLIGGVQYQGVWNAATNTPTLTSSVGTQGYYYIVNVAGNTDLNGITDWKVGDWAIFSGGAWSKVDNTESVTSVNGQTGAVSLTTDNIPEGSTNLYYLDSRARGALSFVAGSGAYNSLTGVITIPTNNNQILNGANYITLASLSANSPLTYNNLTGAFGIPQATALVDGYLSATDWSTFNNKQNYLGGTGLVKSTAGTITYITDNSGNWNTAYNRSIVSAAVTGTTTKTLTLNEQDGNTIQASWTDLDTGLTSVGVSMPSAFSVANSPLTANGTIAITGAGTTLEYIDGTGALRTFPGLTGYVPYTGATTNVDLGEFGISAGYFQADLTPTGALQVGRMQWNANEGTMDLRLLGNNVTLQIGQENVTRVVNKSGIDLLEANYQVVRIRKVAEGGAQGQRLAVVLAQGNNENNSTEVIGLVTETINVNQEGFVTSFGEVKSINTTGSLQGETWVDGDILYLSSTVAGQLTNVRPVAPNHSVIVGYVVYAHPNNGKIYMAIDTGYELGELHNVYAPSPTANQSIYWNVANSRYQLNTIGGILGYTPANAATTISTTAPLQGGGDLSANRTFSITQSGASTDGYLSSTDWNTFNNKQPAGSYVPTSRLLSINGTQYDLSADRSWSVGTVTSVAALTLGTSGTDLSSSVANGTTTPVITLNVPTASAANRGALSAADWSTFNTKVGSVTASSPLASSGGSTPNITIQQASGSQNGFLSSTDWTTFNNKQAAGNYITSLTGEATATGPGAAAVTLNNASVTAKVLTGINITGGTVQATDTMLTAFGKLQNQINGLIGSTIYQGTWNASTNTPALASGVGVRGYYYIVSVAGNTNLDGITDWFVGDWAIFDGTAWQQVDNTDAVVSVNGQTGAVSLTTDNIPEGATNQYFLNSRARAALSFTAGSGAYNSTTGVITIPTNTNQLTNGASFITLASLSGTAPIVYSNTTGAISITQAGTASNGYLSSTDWNTFNNKQNALTNPVTGTGNNNYIAKFTSTGSTIGNSLLQSTASNVFIFQEDTSFGIDAQAATRLGFTKKGGFGPYLTYATDPFIIASSSGTDIAAVNTFTPRFQVAITGEGTIYNNFSVQNAATSGTGFFIDQTGRASGRQWSILNGNTAVGEFSIKDETAGFTRLKIGLTGIITLSNLAGTGSRVVEADASGNLSASSTLSSYLPLAGGVMTGQIVLAAGTTSTDYTKGLRFPNDPYGGSGDTSGLRLYADTSTGAEAQVLELYVTNDGAGGSQDRINFYAPSNDLVTINGNKIWNAGNLTPQSAITLTTTGTSGAATLVGATLNIPNYSGALSGYVPYTGATTNVNLGNNSLNIGGTAITDRMFQVSGVNFTTGASQFMSVFNTTFSGTITNAYGIYVGNNFGTGTITNSYNLYVEASLPGSATVTNKYGIFQAGANDINNFEGNTQINGLLGAADNKGLRLRGITDSTHRLYYSTTRVGIILEINNTFSIDFYNTGSPSTPYTFTTGGDFANSGKITTGGTIQSGDNVGIRIAPSASYYLITGNAGITGSNAYFGTGQVRIGGGADAGANTVLSVAPGVITFDRPGVAGGAFKVHSDGKIGINATVNNGYQLEVQTNATTAGLWVQTGGTTNAYTIADFRTGTNASAFNIKADLQSTFGGTVTIATGTIAAFALGVNSNSTFAFGSTNGRRAVIFAHESIGDSGLQFGWDTTDKTGIIAGSANSTGAGIDFYTYNGSSWANRMRVTKDGNVGIGIGTPAGAHMLQINNPTQNYVRMNMTNTTTGTSNTDGLIFQMENNLGIIKNQEADRLCFGTSGRETDIIIAANGIVGIGVNPTGTWTTRAAVQIGAYGTSLSSYQGGGGATELMQNAIVTTGFNYVYAISASATKQYMDGNNIIWYRAPIGTAGAAITFSQLMNINSTGLAIGGSSNANLKLTVYESGSVITSGTVNFATQAKGIELYNEISGTTDNLVGYWFSTGPHKAGIASGRTNAAANWAVDLRFFVHGPEIAQLDQTYEKMRLGSDGTLTCVGDVIAYGSPSDSRLKIIKEKVPNALASVLKLNGYRFDWKEINHLRNYKEDIGVIAQEVAELFPELARTNGDGNMSVRYQGLTAVLIEAIKEQQKQIDELKKQLA